MTKNGVQNTVNASRMIPRTLDACKQTLHLTELNCMFNVKKDVLTERMK